MTFKDSKGTMYLCNTPMQPSTDSLQVYRGSPVIGTSWLEGDKTSHLPQGSCLDEQNPTVRSLAFEYCQLFSVIVVNSYCLFIVFHTIAIIIAWLIYQVLYYSVSCHLSACKLARFVTPATNEALPCKALSALASYPASAAHVTVLCKPWTIL